MKHSSNLFVWLLLMPFLLIACSDNEAGSGSGEETDDGTQQPLEFSISMRTLATEYVENHPDINDDTWLQELEELTNTDIHIELIPHKEYVERMTLLLASGDIPDVVQVSGGLYGPELAGAVEAGVFMPLNDLLEKHGQNLLQVIPKQAWDQVTASDGTIYAIPDYLENRSRRGVAIRMDLLEQTDLDIPETTDEYLDVLRAFKELGVENPYQGREQFKYADTFFGAFDAFPYQWEYYEGEVVPKFMAGDKILDALAYYKTMYEEGLIHREFLTTPQPEYRSNIISGKAGMWSMNAEEVLSWEQEIQTNTPEAEIEIIPSPIGPDGKGGHSLYNSTTRAFLINQGTEADIERLIQFFDWQVSEEAHHFFTYGIEGETYTISEDGTIDYTVPTDINGINEQRYRNYWLWLIRDSTFTRGVLEQSEDGQRLIEIFDGTLAEEGRDSVFFDPPLEMLQSNPEIRPSSDVPADLWLTGAAEIILGRQPIDYHDQIIENWLNKGGKQVIEEATQRYHDEDGIQLPED